MKVQQRVPLAAESTAIAQQLWRPTLGDAEPADAGEAVAFEVRHSDTYVTIDERVGSTVGVVACPWPNADSTGLSFPEPIDAAWFNSSELQATIDAFRLGARQVARPLRIGDAFWVRGFDGRSLTTWEDLRDVTRAARSMVKLAVASVAVGQVRPQDLIDRDDDEPAAGEPTPPTVQMVAQPTV